jgi:hypothetical protein
MKGGSATPTEKGRLPLLPLLIQAQEEGVPAKARALETKKSIWGNPNKHAYQSKARAPLRSLSSCFVLKNNSKGEVIAKYVGKDANVYLNTSIWVPKILVTNMQGPKNIWDLNQGTKLVLQAYSFGGSSWVLDSGCINHMTEEKSMFSSYFLTTKFK